MWTQISDVRSAEAEVVSLNRIKPFTLLEVEKKKLCVLSCHFFTRNKTVFVVVSGLLLLITMVVSTVVSALMVLPVLMPAAVWVTVAVNKQYQTLIIQIIKICSTIITDCPYRQNEAYGRYYYGPPYTRYGQFLIGMVAGILLTTKTDRWLKKKVRTFYTHLCVNCLHACSCSSPLLLVLQWHAAIGWILCLTLLAAVSILPYVLEEKPLHPSAPHALYSGTHRSLWALALTWIIVACEEGYGGKQQHCHINSTAKFCEDLNLGSSSCPILHLCSHNYWHYLLFFFLPCC